MAAQLLSPVAVLRTHPVGEADLVVGLISPERGRVDAFVRGARSSRKRFSNVIRPFCELEVLLEPPRRGTLGNLIGADTLRELLDDHVDYEQLCLASYLTELAAQVVQPEHADPALFRWLMTRLVWCRGATAAALAPLKAAADAGFLQVLGLLPDLARCARCGVPLVERAIWSAEELGPVCLQCGGPQRDRVAVSALRALSVASLRDDRESAILVESTGRSLVDERLDQLMRHAVPTPQRAERALRALMRGMD